MLLSPVLRLQEPEEGEAWRLPGSFLWSKGISYGPLSMGPYQIQRDLNQKGSEPPCDPLWRWGISGVLGGQVPVGFLYRMGSILDVFVLETC